MTKEYAEGMPIIGQRWPGAKPLQVELKRVGYMDTTVELSDDYNAETQAAVKRFYAANADKGWQPSGQIGPVGWAHLQTENRGVYLHDKPEPPQ